MYYTDYISSRTYSVAIYLYISTPISPPLPLTGRAAQARHLLIRHFPYLPLRVPDPARWLHLLSKRRLLTPTRRATTSAAAHRTFLRSAPPSCSVGACEHHIPIPHTDPLCAIACGQFLRPWRPWQQRQACSHRSVPARVRGCLTPIIIEANAREVNRQLRSISEELICADVSPASKKM